jgi:indole-3-glycerol phosphate synthase
LAREGLSLIAEIKKASPSKGVLREDFDPVTIARCYEDSGADAISILTDSAFFQGSLEYLRLVRDSVKLPLLRKDFIIDFYQLYEAAVYGADAVLLIVSVLGEQLKSFLDHAHSLGLDALVEVHNGDELSIALKAGAKIIGVNNRDLSTFNMDLRTTFNLAGLVPDSCLLVSESGISTGEHIMSLAESGVDAVLIGETLMTSPSPGLKVKEMVVIGKVKGENCGKGGGKVGLD